jgi:glutaredoxin 3
MMFIARAGEIANCRDIMDEPVKPRLFIKPWCSWCQKAMSWLDEQGIEYETIDVTADEAALEEMIRLSGQDLTPVLQAGGKVLADFGPEQLPTFWKEISSQK